MRVKTRVPKFLFPIETDSWLTVLRLGLGLQVTLSALSLRTDWAYLFSGTARKVAEALLSLQGHFIPSLGSFVALAARLDVPEETVLLLAGLGLLVSGCALLLGVACRFSA